MRSQFLDATFTKVVTIADDVSYGIYLVIYGRNHYPRNKLYFSLFEEHHLITARVK